MNNSLQPIIRVKNLWKVFGINEADFRPDEDYLQSQEGICAVKDVSLEINSGEVFMIMGLSGSGKSTLIRCLLRLVEPSAGAVEVNGRNVTEMTEKELTDFRKTEGAMVFQHYGLLPHRTVLDNVAFGLKLRGIKKKERYHKAQEVIERVGLKEWQKHYPAQLSGGMQQRVGIARALVQDTNCLLMDEPFSGLDPLIKREMQDELIRMQNDFNKTIIFVTHDLNEAIRLGDRMVVMRQGSIIQQGVPAEIVNNPVDDYVRRFVQNEDRSSIISHKAKGKVRSLQDHAKSKTGPAVAGGVR